MRRCSSLDLRFQSSHSPILLNNLSVLLASVWDLVCCHLGTVCDAVKANNCSPPLRKNSSNKKKIDNKFNMNVCIRASGCDKILEGYQPADGIIKLSTMQNTTFKLQLRGRFNYRLARTWVQLLNNQLPDGRRCIIPDLSRLPGQQERVFRM
ncbi:hypothetical protein C8R43DRAFT_1004529 [Mycena crocata]|nr:hypothetical protein C8R43DRAFT_1004529 [Mycena crocata]